MSPPPRPSRRTPPSPRPPTRGRGARERRQPPRVVPQLVLGEHRGVARDAERDVRRRRAEVVRAAALSLVLSLLVKDPAQAAIVAILPLRSKRSRKPIKMLMTLLTWLLTLRRLY